MLIITGKYVKIGYIKKYFYTTCFVVSKCKYFNINTIKTGQKIAPCKIVEKINEEKKYEKNVYT